MGEELELKTLYMKDINGEYVPFTGLTPMDIIVCDDMDEETYNSLPKEGWFTIECIQTHKQLRTTWQFMRKMKNRMRREKRTMKRRKEKLRRMKLKEHGYL